MTSKNTKNCKAFVSKWRSHNDFSYNAKSTNFFIAFYGNFLVCPALVFFIRQKCSICSIQKVFLQGASELRALAAFWRLRSVKCSPRFAAPIVMFLTLKSFCRKARGLTSVYSGHLPFLVSVAFKQKPLQVNVPGSTSCAPRSWATS